MPCLNASAFPTTIEYYLFASLNVWYPPTNAKNRGNRNHKSELLRWTAVLMRMRGSLACVLEFASRAHILVVIPENHFRVRASCVLRLLVSFRLSQNGCQTMTLIFHIQIPNQKSNPLPNHNSTVCTSHKQHVYAKATDSLSFTQTQRQSNDPCKAMAQPSISAVAWVIISAVLSRNDLCVGKGARQGAQQGHLIFVLIRRAEIVRNSAHGWHDERAQRRCTRVDFNAE